MRFTDTHTHLNLKAFDVDQAEMIKRALDAGVYRFFLPNINSCSAKSLLVLQKKYPKDCFSMMGLHPCYVKEDVEKEINIIEKWHEDFSFIAVGEIGLDFYRDVAFFEEQKWAFKKQLVLAQKLKLPVSIHCRNSIEEIFNCFEELKLKNINGVFHCFSGNSYEAKKIIKYGLKLGIGGVLTFKNSGLGENIKNIPLSNIVLETDAPYLAPDPFRGTRNESAYIKIIALKLSEIFNVTLNDVSKITEKNVKSVFGI